MKTLSFICSNTLETLFPTRIALHFCFFKIESCIITLLEAADQLYLELLLLNGSTLLRTVETELSRNLQGLQSHESFPSTIYQFFNEQFTNFTRDLIPFMPTRL